MPAARGLSLGNFGRGWLKPVVLILLVLPALWLAAHWAMLILELTGNGNALTRAVLPPNWLVNPIEATHHFLGETALRLLLMTLAVRPVREIAGWPPIMIVRRHIGLAAFFYALAHLLAYFGMDLFFSFARLWDDVVHRLYITLGMAALLLLLPLAVTSTNGMIKRLGALRWRRLHMLIYPAAILAALHHHFMVKSVQSGPLIHGAILAALLLYRLYGWMRARARRAARAKA